MLEKKFIREIIYILLGLLGALLVILNTWNYGVGLTDDSINYIYSGVNLLDLKGFYNYDGSIFINWPPFYPLIIFILSQIHSDIYMLMLVFNATIYCVTVYLLGKFAEIIFTLPILKILYTTTLAFSFQMLYIYTKVWSETVFITCVILLVFLLQIKKERNTNIYLLLLVMICALTRYVGISVAITYFLYLILSRLKTNKINLLVLSKAFLIIFITATPLFLWFIRNKYATDSMSSLHLNSPSLIGNVIISFFDSLSSMFIPESFDTTFRICIFILFLLILFVVYFIFSTNKVKINFYTVFLIMYICLLLLISCTLKFENISARYLSPIYFIVLIYILSSAEYLLINLSKNIQRILVWSIVIIILVFPIEKGLKHTFINYKNGIEGFSSKTWKESETIKYIKANLYHYNIYSNSVAGIYANTGKKTNRISNYSPNSEGQNLTARVVFKNTLPAVNSIPDLIKTTSDKDSIVYMSDSYIIFKRK